MLNQSPEFQQQPQQNALDGIDRFVILIISVKFMLNHKHTNNAII